MALILEVRDARGVPAWRRLDALPISIGRGYSNDLIVDDPYVDAVHARITQDDTGALVLEDTGTVNGVYLREERVARVPLGAGVELRIGRTRLRVHDASEPVTPALVESPRPPRILRPLWSVPGRWVLVGAMLAATALTTWLGSAERQTGSAVFGMVLGALVLALIWAAIWGLAARGPDRRFHFLGHLAVVSLAVLGFMGWFRVSTWLAFLFPDSAIVTVIGSVVGLAGVTLLVVGHLAVANVLTSRGRWRAGLVVSGSFVLLFGAGAAIMEDEFTDVPTFQPQIRHAPAILVPTQTMDEFLSAMEDAKASADEAAEQGRDM